MILVGALAVLAAGCGGGGTETAPPPPAASTGAASTGAAVTGGGAQPAPQPAAGNVTALPSSSCENIEYGGTGTPDILLASDLVRQGADAPQNTQIVNAIRYILDQNKWTAGSHQVAYQSCDDSTAQAGKWDPAKCSQNAQAYAGNDSLWAVIGTFNSGCAAIIIPVLNQAPGGGIAMISAANTWLCLTVTAPTCDDQEPGSPGKWYPNGSRNYARVVVDDSWQGSAVAQYMQTKGIKSVYILNDKEPYGQGVAENLRAAAESIGIEIKGFEAWNPKASNYEALMTKIGKTGAEAIFLGGLLSENGAQIIKDKVSVLGPNDGKVKLFTPDGFVLQNTIDTAGPASKGIIGSVAGLPYEKLTPEGQAFVDAMKAKYNLETVDPYAIYGAAATQVILNAIANASDRADVIKQMFATKIDTVIGPVAFNADGDRATSPVTIYLAGAHFDPVDVVSPKQAVLDAARGIKK